MLRFLPTAIANDVFSALATDAREPAVVRRASVVALGRLGGEMAIAPLKAILDRTVRIERNLAQFASLFLRRRTRAETRAL